MKRGETQTVTTPAIHALNQIPGCIALRCNSGQWRVKGGMLHGAPKGTCDIIGSFKGRFFAIETKTETGKLDPDQASFMAQVIAHGGIAFCARSPAEAVKGLLERASGQPC